MNTTIYANTLMKMLKHKFVAAILVIIVLGIPLTSVGSDVGFYKTATIRDSYLVSFVLGMLIITLTNPFPITISFSGRMDYMPLIVTRPIARWQYVCSKWLALGTVLGAALTVQQALFLLLGRLDNLILAPDAIICSFVDRILIALSMSSVLTFVYLLPTELTILIGILAVQVAAASHLMSFGFAFPHSQSSETVTDLIVKVFGFKELLHDQILPILIGSSSQESMEHYLTLLKNCALFLAPDIHTHDLFKARPIFFTPVIELISNIALALTFATITLNTREFHYDTD